MSNLITSFTKIKPFYQGDIIDSLGNRLNQDSSLANLKLDFLPEKFTLKELWNENQDGLCWGICANIAHYLENPLLKMRAPHIKAEDCIKGFLGGIQNICSSLTQEVRTLYFQHVQRESRMYEAPPSLSDPNDMNSPFSMWYMESAKNEEMLHAILASNKDSLGRYFIFDPNLGLYQSSPKFTRELNDILALELQKGKNKAEAMLEVIRESAKRFAQIIPNYKSLKIFYKPNAPRTSSRNLFNAVEAFIKQMGPTSYLK